MFLLIVFLVYNTNDTRFTTTTTKSIHKIVELKLCKIKVAKHHASFCIGRQQHNNNNNNNINPQRHSFHDAQRVNCSQYKKNNKQEV